MSCISNKLFDVLPIRTHLRDRTGLIIAGIISGIVGGCLVTAGLFLWYYQGWDIRAISLISLAGTAFIVNVMSLVIVDRLNYFAEKEMQIKEAIYYEKQKENL